MLMISFHIVDKNPFILYSQYHGYWWPGEARGQGINIYGNSLLLPELFLF